MEEKFIEKLQTISIYDFLVGLLSEVIYFDNNKEEKEELEELLQDECNIDLSSDNGDRKECLVIAMALKFLYESAEIEVDTPDLLEQLLDNVLKDVTKVLELDKELTPEELDESIKKL